MHNEYTGVVTRFLRKEERLILSNEQEMPLVLEAKESRTPIFLQNFLKENAQKIKEDIAKSGAVLLRGFDIESEAEFERTILSISGLKGINEAFMSEEGRVPVGDLKYVLHTNAVYKTGGTLYLGGFHSENYYSPDVPSYICFYCMKPSVKGGETGIINMEKVYQHMDKGLKDKLEKNTFFVSKWLVSEVAERYHLSTEGVEKLAKQCGLPLVGEGKHKFILMHKPSVFVDPETEKPSLQINLFELLTLNEKLRKHFMQDYQGSDWFWHRLVWRLPSFALKIPEYIYIMFSSFFYSPKDAIKIVKTKFVRHRAWSKAKPSTLNAQRVGGCFEEDEVEALAKNMRDFYSSCLWKKGDILLIDNKKVVHAGMPGSGKRRIRAMICNPLTMPYSFTEPGYIVCQEKEESIGFYTQL